MGVEVNPLEAGVAAPEGAGGMVVVVAPVEGAGEGGGGAGGRVGAGLIGFRLLEALLIPAKKGQQRDKEIKE